jgi:hypothetical protein
MDNSQMLIRAVQRADQERQRRIKAERQARALRATLLRMAAQRRAEIWRKGSTVALTHRTIAVVVSVLPKWSAAHGHADRRPPPPPATRASRDARKARRPAGWRRRRSDHAHGGQQCVMVVMKMAATE